MPKIPTRDEVERWRKREGVSLEDLAREAGISVSTLWRWLSEYKDDIRTKTALAIQEAMDRMGR